MQWAIAVFTSTLNVCSCIKQRSDSSNVSAHCGNMQRRGLPATASMHSNRRNADEIWQVRHLCQKLLEHGITHWRWKRPNTVVSPQSLPDPVHGWIFYLRLGSWADESGRADFIQDYSPRAPHSDLGTDTSAAIFELSNLKIEVSIPKIELSDVIKESSNLTLDVSNLEIESSDVKIELSAFTSDTSFATPDTSITTIEVSKMTL